MATTDPASRRRSPVRPPVVAATIGATGAAFAGVLAVAVSDAATFGKLFSEAIEAADKRASEGVASTGGGTAHDSCQRPGGQRGCREQERECEWCKAIHA